MQAEQQSERERFEAWLIERKTSPINQPEWFEIWQAALSRPSTAQGWQPISTAPEGELVVVGWLDDEDIEYPERHDFDFLEDGVWQKHSENHEHFLMVAPPGSRGPSEKAPYTHWQRIGPIPATPPLAQGGKG